MEQQLAVIPPQQIIVTPDDFDAAIKQPWSTQTCILSQCAIRHGLRINNGEPDAAILMRYSDEARCVAGVFDDEWGVQHRANSPQMRNLRKSLPLTVTIPQ